MLLPLLINIPLQTHTIDNEARGAGISEPLVVCCVSVCGKKKLLSRYFYSLAPFFVVSTKLIDPWVEFVVSTKLIDPWVEFLVSTKLIDP